MLYTKRFRRLKRRVEVERGKWSLSTPAMDRQAWTRTYAFDANQARR